MSGGNILNYEEVLKKDCYEMHTFLAHRIDKGKLEESLRKRPPNGRVTRI